MVLHTNILISCKKADIDKIVSALQSDNPNLIFQRNTNVLQDRVTKAKIKFFTSVSTPIDGLRFDFAFIAEDVDEKIVNMSVTRAKKVSRFLPY